MKNDIFPRIYFPRELFLAYRFTMNILKVSIRQAKWYSMAQMTEILKGQQNLTLEIITRLEISLQIAIINIPAPK
jgi:antitoxin component HigA of HigAB toxin-antitoxin module